MSKKNWEDETLKPTLEKYPEREETLLDGRERLNTPEEISESELELSPKDKKRVSSYNSFLKAYDQIAKGMEKKVGDRANCDNLIVLYDRSYEENKNNDVVKK